jgi:6-pyruvoyltetrahydropterin/6-carboxytetrahydropterin synthase
MDFGAAKRAKHTIEGMNPKDYFAYLLDHTTNIAEDDPYLEHIKQMDADGIIQLRILPMVGCERFAEHLYNVINNWTQAETDKRVKVSKVEVYEHERNSASFEG